MVPNICNIQCTNIVSNICNSSNPDMEIFYLSVFDDHFKWLYVGRSVNAIPSPFKDSVKRCILVHSHSNSPTGSKRTIAKNHNSCAQ